MGTATLSGVIILMVVGLSSSQGVGDYPNRFPDIIMAKLIGVVELSTANDASKPLAFAVTGSSPAFRQIEINHNDAQACRAVATQDVKTIPHPRVCGAFIYCNFELLNDIAFYRRQLVIAEPKQCPAGTFMIDGNCLAESPTSPCTNNPCAQGNRGQRFTDAYRCNTYITCQQNAEGDLELVHGLCDEFPNQNERFDSATGTCVPDDTCLNSGLYMEEIISCVAATGELPGVSYYNKTFRDANTQGSQQETITLPCPSSQVFDERNCSCVDSLMQCPVSLVTLQTQPDASGKTWRDYLWVLEPIETLVLSASGWAQFDGSLSYTSVALADNELPNFQLEFTFQLYTRSGTQLIETDSPNLSSGQTQALVSNSRSNSPNCADASIEVYIDANRRINARGRTVDGTTQTLTSDPISSFRRAITVRVGRDASGTFTLTVDGVGNQQAALGSARMAATKCGLVMGAANGRNNFVGVMNNVRLNRACTDAEQQQSTG